MLAIVMVVLAALLIQRIFVLQVVNGDSYAENYQLKIMKERTIAATRGNIYDRNGELLAYNELSYNVTIEDSGTYQATSDKTKAQVKNETLNGMIYEVIKVLDENGDEISNSFGISLKKNGSFKFEDEVGSTSQLRFLADVFGRSSADDLTYNKTLGGNEEDATADQIMEYLADNFDLAQSDYADINDFYRIVVIRYALSQYSYSKYITTNIAENVSDKTVAYIAENSDELVGIEIAEDTIRKYVDSEYFAHIIGYTGKISTDEYEELSAEDDEYTLNSVVGKSGIEQVMESELQGSKGTETVYVDNLGKVLEVADVTEASAGNDVYLSIDKKLTEVTYNLIERELAGIVCSKLVNSKVSTTSDIFIPIYDVYFAVINNSIVDITHFSKSGASDMEKAVYSTFSDRLETVLSTLKRHLQGSDPKAFGDLGDEMQDYVDYIITFLKSDDMLDTDLIDTTDDTYNEWKEGNLSLKDYLTYCVTAGWIDTTGFEVEEKYSDASELYDALCEYILSEFEEDTSFAKLVYKYLVKNDSVTGRQLAIILYDQGVLEEDEDTYTALTYSTMSAYDFFKQKIKNIEITPAQLALDPCSASCVITDVDTGELLACVTYPGYDNNRLANGVDSDYYAALNSDLSLPLYNHATQQKTAPGSTFKMLMSAAGLTEGVITTTEEITDEGIFEKVTPSPACWIYNSSHTTHGSINVSEALRDSCNYFFYEVGYRLSSVGSTFDESRGLDMIAKYADIFGLDETTGIEIPESSPTVADEYPIRASIGQSNNSYTTTELARYVTAVASKGSLYKYTLLSKVTDSDGNILEEYAPEVESELDEISDSTWSAIHSGLRMVVKEHSEFDGLKVKAAGKTGTAQEDTTRANHALFVGFAPYNDPEISIATRIAFGYSSSNAADLTAKILSYYFGEKTEKQLLGGAVSSVSSSNSVTD